MSRHNPVPAEASSYLAQTKDQELHGMNSAEDENLWTLGSGNSIILKN